MVPPESPVQNPQLTADEGARGVCAYSVHREGLQDECPGKAPRPDGKGAAPRLARPRPALGRVSELATP